MQSYRKAAQKDFQVKKDNSDNDLIVSKMKSICTNSKQRLMDLLLAED
ncbi:hypothetical protein [Oceanobacillus locisalsi]|uniref:Uncharacterized protein n=1 Tax=Oceanobacillus locisalsi TaxID=546107 RepID=A0ABW3NIR9_9BACI